MKLLFPTTQKHGSGQIFLKTRRPAENLYPFLQTHKNTIIILMPPVYLQTSSRLYRHHDLKNKKARTGDSGAGFCLSQSVSRLILSTALALSPCLSTCRFRKTGIHFSATCFSLPDQKSNNSPSSDFFLRYGLPWL